jgi:Ca2+-binding EF-hand superfamily protein
MLDMAFKVFDKNGDGFISSLEIKEVLGKGTTLVDETWKKIITEVDLNGDGEISFEEFKKMMELILAY